MSPRRSQVCGADPRCLPNSSGTVPAGFGVHGHLGQSEQLGVIVQFPHQREILRHGGQLLPAVVNLLGQLRNVGEHLGKRCLDGRFRVEPGAGPERDPPRPAVPADGNAGDHRNAEVDAIIDGPDVIPEHVGPIQHRSHRAAGGAGEIDLGHRGSGVPAEQKRIAFDELQQAKEDRLFQAASGGAAVRGFEDEVVVCRAWPVIAQSRRHQDGPLVA